MGNCVGPQAHQTEQWPQQFRHSAIVAQQPAGSGTVDPRFGTHSSGALRSDGFKTEVRSGRRTPTATENSLGLCEARLASNPKSAKIGHSKCDVRVWRSATTTTGDPFRKATVHVDGGRSSTVQIYTPTQIRPLSQAAKQDEVRKEKAAPSVPERARTPGANQSTAGMKQRAPENAGGDSGQAGWPSHLAPLRSPHEP